MDRSNNELSRLRSILESLDHTLLQTLAKRFEIASQIGALKKQIDLPIHQPEQWDHVLKDRLQKGEKMGLSDSFLRDLLELIHQESMRRQQ